MAFIRLDRKFFAHDFWKESREYSRAEAWLDLIQMASYNTKQEIIQNKVIEIKRGELPASRRFLERRWNWGNSKVTTFLRMLKSTGMISQRVNQGQTIVKLLKYEDYNKVYDKGEPEANHKQTTNQTTSKPQIKPQLNQLSNHEQTTLKSVNTKDKEDCRTTDEPQIEPQLNHKQTANQTTSKPQTEPNINNNKESKKVNKTKKEREDKFREYALSKCSPSEDLLEDFKRFCDYWTECGERARKLKFEKEKTFDVKRRWNTWLSNKERWSGKRKKVPPKKEKSAPGQSFSQTMKSYEEKLKS